MQWYWEWAEYGTCLEGKAERSYSYSLGLESTHGRGSAVFCTKEKQLQAEGESGAWADMVLAGREKAERNDVYSLGLDPHLGEGLQFSVPRRNETMLKDLAVLPQCRRASLPSWRSRRASCLLWLAQAVLPHAKEGQITLLTEPTSFLPPCGLPRQFYLMPRRASLPS